MKTFYIPLLASALLAAACGQGAQQFDIDNTKPVTPDNRVIYQMNIGAFTPEGTFAAAGRQLGRLAAGIPARSGRRCRVAHAHLPAGPQDEQPLRLDGLYQG